MATWKPTDLLRAYYLNEFRPAAKKRLHRKHLEVYDAALRAFERFVGGRPQLGDVTYERPVEFRNECQSRRCSAQRARNLARCIRCIVREWGGGEGQLARLQPLPPAEPGTLRHYAETVYIPTRMIDCKPLSIRDVTRAVHQLRVHMGRDVRLEELEDTHISEFLKTLLDNGKSRATANNRRANLLAVWNHGFREGLIDHAPRIRKLREVQNVPEAWSHAEMKRIVAAASRFRTGERYGSIPCNSLWMAVLLVAYETGLRRGSIFALRPEDFDLDDGWVTANGIANKTLRGQSFRLSEETIAALRAIWDPRRERVFEGIKVRLQYKHFRLLLDAAGIPQPPRKSGSLFHRIRRTCATLITERLGLSAAGAQLGHSNAEVTRRYIDPGKVRVEGGLVLPRLSAAG